MPIPVRIALVGFLFKDSYISYQKLVNMPSLIFFAKIFQLSRNYFFRLYKKMHDNVFYLHVSLCVLFLCLHLSL